MRVLLTGGSGDMGVLLTRKLTEQGDKVVVLDMVSTHEAVIDECDYIKGSILDRNLLKNSMSNIDCVVHIAAWHGIYEHNKSKDAYDFHDVNVTGTFNVFQTAAQAGIKKIVLISSTSVDDCYGLYGHTKILNEEMARTYAKRHNLDILVLRPRAFIPPWNKTVYKDYIEWINWFCKGSVHINDVCQATLKSINFLKSNELNGEVPILTIDGAYDYTTDELDNWNDTTFTRRYGEAAELLAEKYGVNFKRKPKVIGSIDAKKLIGYIPEYSMKDLLSELSKYGKESPPFPLINIK